MSTAASNDAQPQSTVITVQKNCRSDAPAKTPPSSGRQWYCTFYKTEVPVNDTQITHILILPAHLL